MFLSKRNGIYYVIYLNDHGKRTCISTKTRSKQEAYTFLSNLKNVLSNRERIKIIPIPLGRFCFEFLKHAELHNATKTIKAYKVTFNFLQEYFGLVNLADLTERRLQDYFNHRLSNSSIYQARKDRINLHACFRYAIERGYLIKNPISKIRRFRIPEKQPLYFSESDFQILLETIQHEDIKDLVVFAANTGLRQMELLSMKWNQVNFVNRFIILDNQGRITKSKKVRTIPVNLICYQILSKRIEKNLSEYIFSLNGLNLSPQYLCKIFKDYVIKAGLNPRFHFHSLRHSFASWLVQRGISIFHVKELLGHSDIKTTEIYAHLSPDNLRNSVESLSKTKMVTP